MFRSWLHETLSRAYPGHLFDILVPPDSTMGDYSTNLAMVLAKQAKKSPRDVAAEVCAALQAANDGRIGKCEPAGPGFVNIFIADDWLRTHFHDTPVPQDGKGKKIIVEYPSTNVAKPMHVGHSRPAFIGDALARVHEALGYEVIRWDHLGDWGTQFGMIIAAYKEWGDESAIRAKPLEALNDLYVRWQAKAKDDDAYAVRAREEFRRLEAGDAENRRLWGWFTEESLKESKAMYERLGLLPAHRAVGESAYLDELPALVDELKAHGVARDSEGAVVVDLEAFGLPPALIRKTDGASVYLTRDIASLRRRIREENPDKILYVVANQQALHLEQLFAVGQLMKFGSTELVHVKFGLVLGESGKKLSTREGTAVALAEVVDEAVRRAGERNPATAEAVGVGALKYNDLRQHPHTDITFDWEQMLDLGGNSGPYLQYSYARLAGILGKAGEAGAPDRAKLVHPAERALMRHLADYGHAVAFCAREHALNGLALHLYQLAEKANRFYEQVRVGEDDDAARKGARLELVRAAMAQMKAGLGLLGISVMERI